jgi:predicted RND superfamily exporter protein
MQALEAAAVGTGLAIVGSTVSSAAGFAIITLAPMPLFANSGLLTAIMVVLALISSPVVSREPIGSDMPRATT